jgi:tRNA C32,U32 (ribose-2'-O)-methylase TrmJ
LAEDAITLIRLEPAGRRTVILLGHEHRGVPKEAWPLIDEVVEIPMIGYGASLNVAVSGSLVLYRLAGLARLALDSRFAAALAEAGHDTQRSHLPRSAQLVLSQHDGSVTRGWRLVAMEDVRIEIDAVG